MPDLNEQTNGLAKPPGATSPYSGLRLMMSDLRESEQARMIWCIQPQSAMVPGDFLRPETYAHCFNKLHRGDRFEVLPADGAWWGEFLVQGMDGPDVRVACLRLVDLEPEAERAPDEYRIEFVDAPDVRWRIVRKSDHMIMQAGFATKKAALGWLRGLGTNAQPNAKAA